MYVLLRFPHNINTLAGLVLAPPAGFNAAQNRPLICVEDVEGADGELTLPPHAIITPLALERARELGVVLRRIPH